MCGAFSAIPNRKYAKVAEEDVREKMHAAMTHVKFTLDLCFKQYREGRLFFFEHPASASSWTTAMMEQMLALGGV